MKIAKYSYLISLLLILGCDRHIDVQPTDAQVTNLSPSVIPAINKWTGGVGFFSLTDKTEIIADDELKDLAEIFAQDIKAITGQSIKVESNAISGSIHLLLDVIDKELG